MILRETNEPFDAKVIESFQITRGDRAWKGPLFYLLYIHTPTE